MQKSDQTMTDTTVTEETGTQIERVKIRVLPDQRVTREDAARYIGIGAKTLANWALVGKGPPPIKVGRRVFYRLETLDAFVRGETTKPAAAQA